MEDFIIDFKNQLHDIKVTDANPEKLKSFSSEEDFIGLGVDLLIETGSYVCIAACLLTEKTGGWNRNQAIIGGNLVRLFKLISAILDQTCQRRRETTFVFARLAFETIVNLSYLIKNSSTELFNSYVRYSLQHEKKLYNLIHENIEQRKSGELPIETRMLSSIQRTFKKSEIDAQDIGTSDIRNWGNKNLFERAKDVGLENVYLAAFGGGSHTVHGNWMDLVEYHLDSDENGFKPQLEWQRPRPQILMTISYLTAKLLQQYFLSLNEPEITKLVDGSMENLIHRNRLIDSAHEEFLHRDVLHGCPKPVASESRD